MSDNGICEDWIMRRLFCKCLEFPKESYRPHDPPQDEESDVDIEEGCLLSQIIFSSATSEHLRDLCEEKSIGSTLDILEIPISSQALEFLEEFQADQDCSMPFGECLRNNEHFLPKKYKEILDEIRSNSSKPNSAFFKRRKKKKINPITQPS